MDIRTLQYFLAVAREESITRAAQSLHITQPPLSRQLKELEQELGTQLFVRGPRKITLTEDGILLRRRAEEMIALLEKTKSELKHRSDEIQGDIAIGAGETQAMSFLARAAAKLQAIHPRIHYRLYDGDAASVHEMLNRELIDFGLFVGPVDVSQYDSIRLPEADRWGVLMRRDCPLADKDTVQPTDLSDKPLFLAQQAVTNGVLPAWMNMPLADMDIVLTCDLIYNASLFVREGIGYAVTLEGIINTTGDSELCFRPLYPSLTAELTLVWKKYQVFSSACREFLLLFKNECELTARKTSMSESSPAE